MKKNCCFVNILIFSLLMFCGVSIFADDAKTESKIDFEGNTVRTTTSKDENDNDVITIETDYVGGKKKTSETKVTDVFNNVVSTKTHVYIKDEDDTETTTDTFIDSDGKKSVDVEKKDKDGNITVTKTFTDQYGYEINIEKFTDKNGKITINTTKKDSAGNIVDKQTEYSSVENEKRKAEDEKSAGSDKKKDKNSKKQDSKSDSESKEAEKTTINIENARNTRYEKDKDTGNDVIVLIGDVRISVTKGSSKNIINADSVKYDRVSEMIYADGNVSLEQTTENSGGQTVTASSLMFNTSTLEGIFDDGRAVQTKSDALNLPSGSTLIVASDIFGRSESNTIAFKDGELTFCDDEAPHWKIKASRIWLLPGGEFAFLNAKVYTGPVPVLYLPAFYYPKDELIFNPVFGYEKKRGYYMQTTAYVFGRKPLDSGSSSSSSSTSDSAEKLKALFNFVKPSVLKEQKQEGLMLHNLDSDFKGNTSNYVKIMGDYYTNQGFMLGLDSVFKPKKIFSDLSFMTKIGFSNTVFKDETTGEYLPYSSYGNKLMDSSNLMGIKLPFRYSGNFKTSITAPFSLSLSVPVYSDPFFSDHFDKREETMDWISFLIAQSQTEDDTETSTNEISSFTWTLNSSYNVPLPSIVKPYISSLSFTLNSSLVFSSMTTDNESLEHDDIKNDSELEEWRKVTPQRKFYYPSQITPATITGTLSGTLIDFSSSRKAKVNESKIKFSTNLVVPDEFLTEAEKQKKIEEAEKLSKKSESEEEKIEESNSEENKSEEEKEKFSISLFPLISGASASVTNIPGTTFTMKYSIKPSLTTQIAYSSSNLKSSDDFKWNELKSTMYTFKMPVTVDNNFSYGGSFFTVANSFSYNPVWQEHPYVHINEDAIKDDKGNLVINPLTGKPLREAETAWYSKESAFSLKKTDYAAEKQDLSNSNTVSLKPFAYIPRIKDTGITWRTSIKMIRTEFLADQYKTEEDSPEWDYHWIDWDDENCITTNALDFTFATNQFDSKFTQSFTLTTTLKPLKESYYGTLKLGFPFTIYQIEYGVKKEKTTKTVNGKSEEDEEWKKQPLKQSLTVSGKVLKSTMAASASYNYNMEDEYNDSLKFSFSWYGLTAAYQMSYVKGYDFYTKEDVAAGVKDDTDKTITSAGWHQRSEQEFLPYSASVSYSSGTKTFYSWKNRINLGFGVNTSITADLLKPTSSYFNLTPTLSLKIHEFFTMNFSATVKNSVIARYFGNKYDLPGETNIFKDIANSFRFDDESLREASGFKLKSLNLTMTHEMHDWDFNASFKVEPRLVTETEKIGGQTKSSKHYDFNPYITISIVWRPMSAMKTEIVDKYGEWQLK